MIFGLLSLANLGQNDDLHFHPFTWNDKIYIFLIHLSVVGHLGCFHNLAIVNSAAINLGGQVPLE
jgi:hypothetical protein